MDRDSLVQKIRTWIELDSELKELCKKSKELRKQKKHITEDLTTVMRKNDIDCFDINNGKLIYFQRNVRKPLSKKHLMTALANYLKDSKEACDIGNYIMDTRTSKVVENIRIKK
tara:strand:- start:677 stop:1018 length:342 start_codon:yes stop_codon:yes gene_type:complete